MSKNVDRVGECPSCGTTIPQKQLLIRYSIWGVTTTYAGCHGCGDVVQPK